MLRHVRILDVPNERSAHTNATPKCGGVSIGLAFLLAVAMIALEGRVGIGQRYFEGLVLATLAIAGVSFYDDVTSKPFVVKLLTQLVAVYVALAAGIVTDQI